MGFGREVNVDMDGVEIVGWGRIGGWVVVVVSGGLVVVG